MFWAKKNTIERKLADAMGYEYCTLFDSARSALRFWREKARISHRYPPIPSNVCPALREVLASVPLIPVNPLTGLANGVGVQLYGYRNEVTDGILEIDPLMTGFLRRPLCSEAVISFGRKKMLDIGGGGALLSNTDYCRLYNAKAYFPEALRSELEFKLRYFVGEIASRWGRIERWDRLLGDTCIRVSQEQIMPWRVMRRIPKKRDAVVKALREAGHAVGTNYPPLPGVTDAGAIQWGEEVINFFPDYVLADRAVEIIKRVLA